MPRNGTRWTDDELIEYLENLFQDVRNNRHESVHDAADHLKRYFL